MAAPKSNIEFLTQEDWEKGKSGKLLKWALTVGRHIVIFTEFIVILAFLSRFKFDRDLTDITEEVKLKQAVVANFAQFEKEFRTIQKELLAIDSLRKNQIETDQIIDDLAKLLPLDVYLSEINTSGNQISLNAIALSEVGLASFIRSIKTSPDFFKTSLSQISFGNDREIGIKFQIKTEFNKNGS